MRESKPNERNTNRAINSDALFIGLKSSLGDDKARRLSAPTTVAVQKNVVQSCTDLSRAYRQFTNFIVTRD